VVGVHSADLIILLFVICGIFCDVQDVLSAALVKQQEDCVSKITVAIELFCGFLCLAF
jgi:hypothetical protein